MDFQFDYKKLRVAQDLNKTTVEKLKFYLLSRNDLDLYDLPTSEEVFIFLHRQAREGKIDHFILKGPNEDIILFDRDKIIPNLEIQEVKARTISKVIKIQCFDEQVKASDSVPIEISTIKELYRIPKTTFNSGSCIYFLCRKGKVVYIGKAENIHSRLIEHRKSKVFDDVFYLRVPVNVMGKVESALISYLKPKYNKTMLKTNNQKISLAESVLNLAPASNNH